MPPWNPFDPCEPATSAGGRPESPPAHQALLDYLRLGPGRTLQALLNRYLQVHTAPTHSHGTLRKWSSQYDWPARAAAYDELEDQRLRDELRARREAILQRGLALDFERIQLLTTLFEKMNALTADDEAFWIRDVRLLAYPDGSTERVELRRFNGALVRNLRGLLDDLASETGGRTGRASLPIAEEPAPTIDDYSFDALTPEEQAEFIRLQNIILSNPVRHDKK